MFHRLNLATLQNSYFQKHIFKEVLLSRDLSVQIQ